MNRPALAVIGLTALLAGGCREAPPEPDPGANQAVTRPSAPPPRREPFSPPVPVPPVDRETILIASLRAASAAAAGIDDRAEQESLAGRRFVVRERFGCDGPSPQGRRRWLYDEKAGALRVVFDPAPAAAAPQPTDEESPEQTTYVIEPTWLLTAACAPGVAASAPDGLVVLTQTYTEEDSRATRPPAVFTAVKRIAPEQVPGSGLEFVLSGRLEAAADGRVIRCAAASPGGRPNCVVRISFESARIEEPVNAVLIAQWGDP